uniref:G_PROTEIN_RECEP_F1_2 domain-containing protein n=1 Tax=Panagrellus redivivus TaxID=6233 RepID=A0A7E4W362_PANRE
MSNFRSNPPVLTRITETSIEVTTTAISMVDLAEFNEKIYAYHGNIIVGCCCLVICILHCFLLIMTRRFRRNHQIPIALSVANIFAVIGVMYEALDRLGLYAWIAETNKKPKMTSKDCMEIWMLIQVTADFWLPLIEILMGFERLCAVIYPSFFRQVFLPHSTALSFASFFTVVPIIATPVIIRSFILVETGVKYSCGRKAALSWAFGIIDYSFNILGYLTALILNLIAFKYAQSVRQSIPASQKLRCYTATTLASCLLISIPNLASFINAFDVDVPDFIIKPAAIMTCINCVLLPFIYLAFTENYRVRFVRIVSAPCPSSVRSRMLIASTTEKTAVVVVTHFVQERSYKRRSTVGPHTISITTA